MFLITYLYTNLVTCYTLGIRMKTKYYALYVMLQTPLQKITFKAGSLYVNQNLIVRQTFVIKYIQQNEPILTRL